MPCEKGTSSGKEGPKQCPRQARHAQRRPCASPDAQEPANDDVDMSHQSNLDCECETALAREKEARLTPLHVATAAIRMIRPKTLPCFEPWFMNMECPSLPGRATTCIHMTSHFACCAATNMHACAYKRVPTRMPIVVRRNLRIKVNIDPTQTPSCGVVQWLWTSRSTSTYSNADECV